MNPSRRDFFKGALAIIAAPLLSLLPERKKELSVLPGDIWRRGNWFYYVMATDPGRDAHVRRHCSPDGGYLEEWHGVSDKLVRNSWLRNYAVLVKRRGPLPVQKEAGK